MYSISWVLSNASLSFLCVNILVRRHFPLYSSSLQHLAVFFFPFTILSQKHSGTKRTTMKSNGGPLFPKIAPEFPFLLKQVCLIRVTNYFGTRSAALSFSTCSSTSVGFRITKYWHEQLHFSQACDSTQRLPQPHFGSQEFGNCWHKWWFSTVHTMQLSLALFGQAVGAVGMHLI